MVSLLLILTLGVTTQLPDNITPAVPETYYLRASVPSHYKIDSEILRFTLHKKQWRVVLADMSESMCCVGQTEWRDRLIYVERETVVAERPEIVLHELMHAVKYERFSDKKMSGHEFIYAMSPELYKVLADNPTLAKYVVGH